MFAGLPMIAPISPDFRFRLASIVRLEPLSISAEREKENGMSRCFALMSHFMAYAQ